MNKRDANKITVNKITVNKITVNKRNLSTRGVTQQTSGPRELRLWKASANYLAHCVRGDPGEAFQHGQREAVLDSIALGSIKQCSPWRRC